MPGYPRGPQYDDGDDDYRSDDGRGYGQANPSSVDGTHISGRGEGPLGEGGDGNILMKWWGYFFERHKRTGSQSQTQACSNAVLFTRVFVFLEWIPLTVFAMMYEIQRSHATQDGTTSKGEAFGLPLGCVILAWVAIFYHLAWIGIPGCQRFRDNPPRWLFWAMFFEVSSIVVLVVSSVILGNKTPFFSCKRLREIYTTPYGTFDSSFQCWSYSSYSRCILGRAIFSMCAAIAGTTVFLVGFEIYVWNTWKKQGFGRSKKGGRERDERYAGESRREEY